MVVALGVLCQNSPSERKLHLKPMVSAAQLTDRHSLLNLLPISVVLVLLALSQEMVLGHGLVPELMEGIPLVVVPIKSLESVSGCVENGGLA
jgi:hypothetical protein